MDREAICGTNAPCILHFEFVIENPLELHNVALEIQYINDNAPGFPKDSIKLKISEIASTGTRFQVIRARDTDIGINSAVDADSGQNAWLSYQIVKSIDPGLFTIGLHSGEIRAQRDISESDSMKQNLVISVKDNGQPSLSITCAVYLLISDNLAEVPELKDVSKLTSYLIIALVSVSTPFFTFIILIIAARLCHREKPRLLFDAVAIPSAYLPPNYADVDGTGTLHSTYHYDAYMTTESRTSDFKFVTSYNDNTLRLDSTLPKHNIELSEE